MRRGATFWGLILILIGLIVLLDQFDIFGNLNVWGLIGPLFLVLLGAWILLGMVIRPKYETVQATIPLEGATSAQLRFDHGAGRIQVSSGAGSDNLLEGDFSGGLDKDVHRQTDGVKVRLRMPDQFFSFNFGWDRRGLDWIVRLNPVVKMEIELNSGASELKVNLEDLQVNRLMLKTGASSSAITLPKNAGLTSVRVESGVASVSLRVPEGVSARVRAHGGLASISVDRARFPRQGGEYCSPDYETAANKVDISVETGVGSVDIR